MADMAMDAPVGDQAQQMQGPAQFGGAPGGGGQGGIVEEGAVRDGVVDQHQVLANDTTRAQGDVPHLGVAHLAVRQTHGPARGLQGSVGIEGEVAIQLGRARQGDGVVGLGGVDPEAVENDEQDGSARYIGPVGHLRDSRLRLGGTRTGGCPVPGRGVSLYPSPPGFLAG